MHFNEVAKYVYMSSSRAPSDPQVVFVNKEAWAALPEDLQLLVMSVVDRYTQAQHEYLVYEPILALDKFKNAGCEVIKVPKDIEDALTAESAKFYEEKSKKEKPIFEEIYSSMKKYGESYESAK